MSTRIRRVLAAAVLLSFASVPSAQTTPAAAPTANVKTIAGIVSKLNHFPTDAEKKTLQGVVASQTATAHEKLLAEALVNVQHAATAADKPKLESLSKDASAPESVRMIAGTLARLLHMPSDAEKAQLAKLAGM